MQFGKRIKSLEPIMFLKLRVINIWNVFMLRTFSQRIEFGFSRSDLSGFKVYLSLFHQCQKKHASKVDSTVIPDMAVVKLEPADWSSSVPEGSDLLINCWHGLKGRYCW